ncbi:MAG: hypothetical protein QG608_18 [Actinomycetota bacterium]|nr:hypothetical protein [Actinomycetota bacterium]
MTGPTLTIEDIDRLTERFARSARRLETRRAYEVEAEAPALEAFARGDRTPLTDYPYYRPWFERIRAVTAAGGLVQRIRILDEPPTPYQEWEIWIAPCAVEAGENIRYLTRDHARPLGVPTDHDWWLLDDTRLVVLDFDDNDRPQGGHVLTDPPTIRTHRTWWDLASRHATTTPT